MRLTSYFPLHVALAGAMLLLSPLAGVAGSKAPHSKFVGVYRSNPRIAGKTGPLMDVSLGEDGTATVVEDTGTTTATLFGHWVDSGDQVTVTFDPVEGQPAEPPMIFQPTHNGLQAATWNHAIWGKLVPPDMKKGFKVKEKYWFDTVR
jgi:hypothetical protein